jgi:hypothetical protein
MKPELIEKVQKLLNDFSTIAISGITGSNALNKTDSLSDYDIAIIHDSKIPAKDFRASIYQKNKIDVKWIDADFEVSRSDGLEISGFPVDFIHMDFHTVVKCLDSLNTNCMSDEYLYGGLQNMQIIDDKGRLGNELKEKLFSYPENRSIKRTSTFISEEFFHTYTLQWYHKAIIRDDEYSFLKTLFESLDRFFLTAHALNKCWYCEDKRLLTKIGSFPLIPKNAGDRIRKIIERNGEYSDKRFAANEVISLFEEITEIANEKLKIGKKLNLNWDPIL